MLILIGEQTPLKYTSYLNKFVGRCPGTNPKAWYENIKISYMPSGDLSLDFDIVVKQPFGDPLQTTWVIERCSAREALDTCSHFAEFKTKKFCSMLAGTDTAWSSFMSCIHPKYKCPFRKMTYVGRNCSVDPNRFVIPVAGSYWKIKSEVVDLRDNSVALCITAYTGRGDFVVFLGFQNKYIE
ncbi:hypothetical protein QE152_g7812 [Popillia japonica]|uniref:MD-2-related lipid-recognition domain-containing protein n=1 Tax=Popillia japonica TaxID=7064 RepID=A0AAW1M7K6_POPJA